MRQPRVMVCIGFRESMVEPIFSQPWIVTTEPTEADFVIVTERSKCARNVRGIIIDRVERFGRIFAATIEMPRRESRAGQPLE
jgi:chemotaxis signal transduction protein